MIISLAKKITYLFKKAESSFLDFSYADHDNAIYNVMHCYKLKLQANAVYRIKSSDYDYYNRHRSIVYEQCSFLIKLLGAVSLSYQKWVTYSYT